MRLDYKPPQRRTPRRRSERPIRHGFYGENYIGPMGWFLVVTLVLSLAGGIIIELGGWNV